jgi:hypothetical protein
MSADDLICVKQIHRSKSDAIAASGGQAQIPRRVARPDVLAGIAG